MAHHRSQTPREPSPVDSVKGDEQTPPRLHRRLFQNLRKLIRGLIDWCTSPGPYGLVPNFIWIVLITFAGTLIIMLLANEGARKTETNLGRSNLTYEEIQQYCDTTNGTFALSTDTNPQWQIVHNASQYNQTFMHDCSIDLCAIVCDADGLEMNVTNNASVRVPVSRRNRRSLIEDHHHEGQNRWVRLANYTAHHIHVSTPCWVCSLRPHHSGHVPTTAPVADSGQLLI